MRVIAPDNSAANPRASCADLLARRKAAACCHEPSVRRLRVLVPVDFGANSVRSLGFAAALAREFGCSITLLYAVHLNIVGEERGVALSRLVEETKTEAEAALKEVVSLLQLSSAKVVVRVGPPAAAILQEAAESHADLIVFAAREQNPVWRLLRPSVATRVVRRVRCAAIVLS